MELAGNPNSIVVIFLLVSIIGTMLYSMSPIYGHGVLAGGVSRFIRIDNEQFSASNVTVGKTIEVTVELKSLVNRNITISQALIATSEIPTEDPKRFSRNYTAAGSDQWRIVNATYPDGFVLPAGETILFSMNVTALEPGSYHLHSAFTWSYVAPNGTQIDTTYYGRGATIQVSASNEMLRACLELGIPSEECNLVTILQKMPVGPPTGGIGNANAWFYFTIVPIGVGSAVAGIAAFFTLRRLKE